MRTRIPVAGVTCGPAASSSARALKRCAVLFTAGTALSGCAVVTVAGAAAGAAITVTGAVVGTTVKVAGKVVEKTIDVVTPGPAAPAPSK